MATLAQLQEKLRGSTFKRVILTHVIEHLEASFLPKHGGTPEMTLLTQEKLRVPEEAFEAVLKELGILLDAADADINGLLATEYQEAPKAVPHTEETK